MPSPREPGNKLRVDLYRRLIPRLQQEDQRSGVHGFSVHWDDPDVAWDSGDPETAVWDKIGLTPLIQELFYVIETVEGEDLEALESLDALYDPLRAPANVLPQIAASFGYGLDENLSEAAQRTAIIGLIDAFKSRGVEISFKVFFRLLGFDVEAFPLFKKDINEDNNEYNRDQFETTALVGIPIGPAATQFFVGTLADVPIKPGTFRVTDTSVVLRDDGDGNLIGPGTESGTIDYTTGDFTVNLDAPAVGAVTADFERVDQEFPYHAARIDLEVRLSPGGIPIPIVDGETVDGILCRLEEVRPIHVLLRVLTLCAELRDEITPAATDSVDCVTCRSDKRDGVPSLGSTGLDHTYILDQAVRGEDELKITQDFLVGTDECQMVFDEDFTGVCPLDVLVINAGGPDIFV